MSEIRVTRDGNYSSNGRLSDPILLPVGLADGEKEAIGDSLHLLSTFAVIHNKGSVSSLYVYIYIEYIDVCVCRPVAIKELLYCARQQLTIECIVSLRATFMTIDDIF